MQIFSQFIAPVLEWVVLHPGWAGIIVFFVSLCESLVVVGLFIPGILFMSAIGGLVSAGMLAFVSTLLWAIFGAIVGDGISYLVGYHYKERLQRLWPFYRVPKWLDRGKNFFFKHGGKSIVLGRFIGPIRPFIPVVAGMMAMCPKRFLFANVISAIVWAPIYMLPGFSLTMLF